MFVHPYSELVGTDLLTIVDPTGQKSGEPISTSSEQGRWFAFSGHNYEAGQQARKHTWAIGHNGLIFGSGRQETGATRSGDDPIAASDVTDNTTLKALVEDVKVYQEGITIVSGLSGVILLFNFFDMGTEPNRGAGGWPQHRVCRIDRGARPVDGVQMLSRSHLLGQRTGVHGPCCARVACADGRKDALHRGWVAVGERLHREFQREVEGRVAGKGGMLYVAGGACAYGALQADLQPGQAAQHAGLSVAGA